ncbi:hypothetical protein [Spiroplasma endosymbiont of Virgichneumon dumeticola]|uniref:hypothetical protein n=2 Tax=Spiroplasma endosymbiont of Virgichneumon dumeticola TaxID=3139323 RepID=UPI0035C89433
MLPLIIRLIYSALASDDIRVLIVSLLKNYSKDTGLKTVLDSENVSEEELDQPYSTFNPNIAKKLLSILKSNELTILKNELNKLFVNPAKKINNLLKDNTKDLNDKDIEEANNKDEKGWVVLSSSWLKKGNFYKSNKSLKLGLLQVLIQSDTSKNKRWYGPYTYPNVSEETWNLMKVQKGKNGSGAGTIFWRYFLRDFLPSQIRKYVKKQLKEQKGISKGKQRYNVLKSTNINVLKTTAFINRLERGFFKLKEFKTLPKTELGSRAWRVERKEYLTFHKTNNLNKNIGISIYKNKSKYKTWK